MEKFIHKIKVTPMKSAQYVEFPGVTYDAKMRGILNLDGKPVEKPWDLGPITLYASFIWNHISDPKQRLKIFQRLAYHRCMESTPTEILKEMLYLPPLHSHPIRSY